MGSGRGEAGGLGHAPRLALCLLLALAAGCSAETDAAAADVCPEPPTKEVVCYYEGRVPVSRLDACLCTSLVFTDAASEAGDGYAVDVGVRSQVRALRKRNPWLRTLLQLRVGASLLKSEDRRLRASQAVSAALRKATMDGVELDVDWRHHSAANKTHLTTFIKAVRFQLDTADAVDRRRAKRGYEIFERQVDDETTPSWRPTFAARHRPTAPTMASTAASTSAPEVLQAPEATTRGQGLGRGQQQHRRRPSQPQPRPRGGQGAERAEPPQQPRPPGRTLSGAGEAYPRPRRPRGPRGPPWDPTGVLRERQVAASARAALRPATPLHAPPLHTRHATPDQTEPYHFHPPPPLRPLRPSTLIPSRPPAVTEKSSQPYETRGRHSLRNLSTPHSDPQPPDPRGGGGNATRTGR